MQNKLNFNMHKRHEKQELQIFCGSVLLNNIDLEPFNNNANTEF